MPDAPKGLTRGRPVLALAAALAAGAWGYSEVRAIEPHVTARVQHMPGAGARPFWFVDVRARGGGEVTDLAFEHEVPSVALNNAGMPRLGSGETARVHVMFGERVDRITTLTVTYRNPDPRTLAVEIPAR